jgi:hypothetical protein
LAGDIRCAKRKYCYIRRRTSESASTRMGIRWRRGSLGRCELDRCHNGPIAQLASQGRLTRRRKIPRSCWALPRESNARRLTKRSGFLSKWGGLIRLKVSRLIFPPLRLRPLGWRGVSLLQILNGTWLRIMWL